MLDLVFPADLGIAVKIIRTLAVGNYISERNRATEVQIVVFQL
jgi:hypothetical protein